MAVVTSNMFMMLLVPGAYFVRLNECTCPHNLTKSITPAYDPNMNTDSTTVRQSYL